MLALSALPRLKEHKTKEVKLFRNNRSQAVRIPAEFELPGTRVKIHRDGNKLIIEPVVRPSSIIELLNQWRIDEPLALEDQFPDIEDTLAVTRILV